VLALGSDVCLDYVSRPDAFERLYPKLTRGYMLDALRRLDEPAGAVDAFVGEVASAETTRRPSAGLGDDLRFESDRAIGSGLELEEEVLQLSAFSRGGRAAHLRSHRTAEPPADIVQGWTCETRTLRSSSAR
jgi:hypothetical protein